MKYLRVTTTSEKKEITNKLTYYVFSYIQNILLLFLEQFFVINIIIIEHIKTKCASRELNPSHCLFVYFNFTP